MIALYQKWFGEEDVLVKARKLKKKLEGERFQAVMMELQWNAIIECKMKQMNWINEFLKENQ